MRDYIKLFLDKKFPLKIEVVEKHHPKFPNLKMVMYKSGDKRLFVKVLGDTQFSIHYFQINPEQIQMWFQLSYDESESEILRWIDSRLKKQTV